MGRPTTRRKPGNASRPRGVYDPYADELTKPDIVPAAPRIVAETEDLSSILERREQEVFAQSDWRELRRRDEATVVDGPMPQRSEPRHRAPLPTPPSGVVLSARAAAPHADTRREKRPHRRERVRAVRSPVPTPVRTSSPVQRRDKNPARVILMVLLTAVAAWAIGTSLADGALKRVVARIASNFSEANTTSQPLALPTSAVPSVAPSVAPSAVVRRQSAPPTSSDELREVPVMRLEDLLPLNQEERETKAKTKTKTKTKTKRKVGKLPRRSAP